MHVKAEGIVFQRVKSIVQSRKTPGPLTRRESFFGLHFDLHPNKTDKSLGVDITEEMIEHPPFSVRLNRIQYNCKGASGLTEILNFFPEKRDCAFTWLLFSLGVFLWS